MHALVALHHWEWVVRHRWCCCLFWTRRVPSCQVCHTYMYTAVSRPKHWTKRYAINRWRASSVSFDWMIEPILWYCVTFCRHSRQESIRNCFTKQSIDFVCSVVTRLFSKSAARGFSSFSFPPALSSQRTYLSIYALEYIYMHTNWYSAAHKLSIYAFDTCKSV